MKEVEMMDSFKTWKEFKEFYGFWDDEQVYTNCEMLIPVFMVEQWLGQINESHVRPLPCVRDEHGEIKNQTVKDLVEKIDSELTELKWELASYPSNYVAFYYAESVRPVEWVRIADEAADTITAITTLLEALGIDAKARDEAQRRVNNRNRERGRLMMAFETEEKDD